MASRAALPFALLCAFSTLSATARDQVSVVGSSILHALSEAVAIHASKSPDGRDFRIEDTGTLPGIDLFCAGNGLEHPDILIASRRMLSMDVDACRTNGVTEMVEVKIGYDGITLAQSVAAPAMDVSTPDLYLALAAQVPDPSGSGALVPNPYRSWHEVDPRLPDRPIRVLGPPATSGTRDAFGELAMEAGCGLFNEVRQAAGRDRKQLARICRNIRKDGVYQETGDDDSALAKALTDDPSLIGIFGYSVLQSGAGRLRAIAVDGEIPTRETVASGSYPLGRGLFVYYKRANLERLPAIGGYVDELTSEEAWSESGYLQKAGLVPMTLDERRKYAFIADHHVDPVCPPFCW
jgi:phosphate transport system substrate-binding protein